MERIITKSMIGDFANYLRSDEKSENTIEKYLRDVRAFCAFAEAREISKAVVMEFKASLVENYEITSANSMNAAVNAFLRFMGSLYDTYVEPSLSSNKTNISLGTINNTSSTVTVTCAGNWASLSWTGSSSVYSVSKTSQNGNSLTFKVSAF